MEQGQRIIEAAHEYAKASRAWTITGHAEYAEAMRQAEEHFEREVAALDERLREAEKDRDVGREGIVALMAECDEHIDELAKAQAAASRVEEANRLLLATASRLERERDEAREIAESAKRRAMVVFNALTRVTAERNDARTIAAGQRHDLLAEVDRAREERNEAQTAWRLEHVMRESAEHDLTAARALLERFVVQHAEDDYEAPHVCDLCEAAHALLAADEPAKEQRTGPADT